MIFRAVFWIGLVSLLTPHEPDLGLGRPGAGTKLDIPASLLSASGLSRMVQACGAGSCAGGSLPASPAADAAPPMAHDDFRASLAEIKAEIEQDRRARQARRI